VLAYGESLVDTVSGQRDVEAERGHHDLLRIQSRCLSRHRENHSGIGTLWSSEDVAPQRLDRLATRAELTTPLLCAVRGSPCAVLAAPSQGTGGYVLMYIALLALDVRRLRFSTLRNRK
jgi:hypothetical protein